MRILIVDDNGAMRRVLKRTLRDAGFADCTFTEAADGTKALQAVENEMPDFILSDWNMPEMTGIELLKALRERGHQVRAGIVTVDDSDSHREMAAATGASFMLRKPFSLDTMRTAMLGVFSESTGHAPLLS